MKCLWCHAEFEPKRASQKYCTPGHAQKASNARRYLKDEVDLFEEPRQFKVHQIKNRPDGTKVMIVNDTQMPFHDRAVLQAVEAFWDDFMPDIEIFNGDLIDFYGLSVFDHNPTRRFHVQDEIDVARLWLEERVKQNPHAERIWGDGNHEHRLQRWLWKFGPELSSLRALTVPDLLGLDGMGIKYLTYRSVIDLVGFRIEHGYKASTSGAYPINVSRYMAIATGSSGLVGHTHRMSSYTWADSRGSHTCIENGCLCRFDLEYAPHPNWAHGFTMGYIVNNQFHWNMVPIYPKGFTVNGEFYPVIRKGNR